MLKHIVFWKLKDQALGVAKDENAKRMKAELEALPGQISEIKAFEVGLNSIPSPAAWDMVLYSAFEDKQALEAYIKHPAHEKVAQFIGEIRSDRAVVDFEV